MLILRRDPSSAISAALEGWDYPISREALLLADLYDLTGQANTDPKKGKWKPHPGRPFPMGKAGVKRPRRAEGITDAQVAAAMARAGHAAPV